jgi:hypothetical protein
MSDQQNHQKDERPGGEEPVTLEVLSDTASRFLADPEAEAADEDDLPDDRSGVEVPQDGDPGR